MSGIDRTVPSGTIISIANVPVPTSSKIKRECLFTFLLLEGLFFWENGQEIIWDVVINPQKVGPKG
ncbi:hypothetical protein [Salinivibrio sp. IB872]|uniref:hypothetical protein n=1 Tax=Salinivibrio sp. IB872 TaxID=1766123 RepID=UPI001300F9A3|nr:hypothetical protein [Salinivibrio sp. IB872]